MNAPHKIYINVQPLGVDYSIVPIPNIGGIEYIRKNALLKWLDGKLTIEGATEGFVGGYDSALKDVIKHIESL